MVFSTSSESGALVLRIEGELDALTVSDLRGTIDEIVAAAPKKVVVDLSALRLIDSSGVGTLVALFKRVKAIGGDVVVTRVHDQPQAILKLLRLDQVLCR